MVRQSLHLIVLYSTCSVLYHRVSLVFSLQNWLAETPEQNRKAGTPAYVGVGMAGKIQIIGEPCSLSTNIFFPSHGTCSGRVFHIGIFFGCMLNINRRIYPFFCLPLLVEGPVQDLQQLFRHPVKDEGEKCHGAFKEKLITNGMTNGKHVSFTSFSTWIFTELLIHIDTCRFNMF